MDTGWPPPMENPGYATGRRVGYELILCILARG